MKIICSVQSLIDLICTCIVIGIVVVIVLAMLVASTS